MNKRNDYQNTFSQILGSVRRFYEVDSEKEMDKSYIDEYTTKQQKSRDKKITELLAQYVDAYKYKNKSNRWYKGILFGVCMTILIVFCVTFIILMFKVCTVKNATSLESVVQLVSVCITFLTLIISILKIITKYVFPKKEEEYITRIVEIIQNNDLENKKENIRVRLQRHQDIQENITTIEKIDA